MTETPILNRLECFSVTYSLKCFSRRGVPLVNCRLIWLFLVISLLPGGIPPPFYYLVDIFLRKKKNYLEGSEYREFENFPQPWRDTQVSEKIQQVLDGYSFKFQLTLNSVDKFCSSFENSEMANIFLANHLISVTFTRELETNECYYRRSRSQIFKIGVLKNCTKFTGKQCCV